MPKGRLFYLFTGLIIIIAFILGLAAGSIFFKSPVKPAITSRAMVETSSTIEEKAPSSPTEAPPIIESKAPSALPTASSSLEEKVLIPAAKEKVSKYEFHKGMVYAAWSEKGYSNANSVSSMEQMRSLGAEWAGLVTTWYQDKYNSTQISRLNSKTPSDESLIFAIRKLHELKFKVMLKPHLDLVTSEGNWRGDIEPANPEEWQKWFDNYSAFILHYVNIASQESVELFCIGTELTKATLAQPRQWRDLISKIRKVYKGKLTYAANWHNEFSQIEFWDALDYVGIDPYFPLVCSLRPKVEELKSAWEDWIKRIEEWQKKINKPVILTEIGYKSSTDATDEPWQHVSIGELDLQLQTNCYEALFQSFWDKPWFYGVYWWYWGVHPNMGGEFNRGFTPQNKPAQDIIAEWYKKSNPRESY
jgi:hypothetical protein